LQPSPALYVRAKTRVKTLLILQLLAGLALAFITPAFQQADAVALWSDFKAFEARVRADEAGSRILDFGGENPKEGFEQLLDRLFNLGPSLPSRAIGLLISGSSAVALFLLSRTKRPDDHAMHTKP